MKKNYDLSDIGKAISEKIETPMGTVVRSSVVGVIGIKNPLAGVAAGGVNSIVEQWNSFKFDFLLKGLSAGRDTQKRLNQLYTFVKDTPEKAMLVANLFKKTIVAECPKACIIYGLILSENLEKNTVFTHDEMIVCKALENATDYDLENFKNIMENYTQSGTSESRIVIPKGLPMLESYITTCDWAVYNRIFMSRFADVENETLVLSTNYYTCSPAFVLLRYIKDIGIVWNYGI